MKDYELSDPDAYADAASQNYLGELASSRSAADGVPLTPDITYFVDRQEHPDQPSTELHVLYFPEDPSGPRGFIDLSERSLRPPDKYREYQFHRPTPEAPWIVEPTEPFGPSPDAVATTRRVHGALDRVLKAAGELAEEGKRDPSEPLFLAGEFTSSLFAAEPYRDLAEVDRSRDEARADGLLRLGVDEAKRVARVLGGDPEQIRRNE